MAPEQPETASTAVIVRNDGPLLRTASETGGAFWIAFFAGWQPTTIRTYISHLDGFASWMGVTREQLPPLMLLRGGPRLHRDVELFRAHLRAHGKLNSTINGYLSAIRSLSRQLKKEFPEQCPWTLDVDAAKVKPYRDTSGPGSEAVKAMLAAAGEQEDPKKAARDVAILRLLHDRALRRAEIVSLDMQHVTMSNAGLPVAVSILGKGDSDRESLSLPRRTGRALAEWMRHRTMLDEAPQGPDDTRPLFVSLDPGVGRKGRRRTRQESQTPAEQPANRPAAGRLTGDGLATIVRSLGVRAGVDRRVRPHGLRHTAITAVLDAGESLRDTQRFSRHKDVRTVQIYDDNTTDLGGAVAERLSEQL